MRPSDEFPLDPDLVAELEAIDATLAGQAVDPIHAELAELSLLLAGERPRPSAAAARELDARVADRFGPAAGAPSRALRGWMRRPAFASAFVAATAVAVTVVALSAGGPSNVFLTSRSDSAGPRVPRAAAGGTGVASSAGSIAAKRAPYAPPAGSTHGAALATGERTSGGDGGPDLNVSAGQAVPAPTPPANGRRIVQSAQLQLLAPSARIDQVSQELFDVVGQVDGIVRTSNITQSSGNGFAFFALSIPSGNLAETMTRLSTLPGARVASRTDATQDVTNQYAVDGRRLADARALRTSLLRQLASATTTTQIDSLKAQIHDAEASIASDEATLRGLQHRIGYSSLNVQINTAPAPMPVTRSGSSSGGFTLGRAVHDAGRVLTVAAGVALIALAALVPVGLLAAVIAWVSLWVRRRRREHALDVA